MKTILRYSILATALMGLSLARAEDNRPPPHGAHGPPPPEAFSACTDKKSEDACTVTFGEHAMSGVCVASREDETKLFCRPDHRPPPPPNEQH